MLGAFEYSLLKFDVGYPTGEKHKGFGAFALNSVSLSNLLAAEVSILKIESSRKLDSISVKL